MRYSLEVEESVFVPGSSNATSSFEPRARWTLLLSENRYRENSLILLSVAFVGALGISSRQGARPFL